MIDVVAVKDIDNEFQDRGLSYPGLCNKKNGVWRFRRVLFERSYVGRRGFAIREDIQLIGYPLLGFL